MTQDHYKAVVEAGEATEVRIDLVCDTSAGGLDVIVTESVAPVVTDLHFTFADSGLAANKYICNCGRDVRAEVQVIDADTACANLVPTWSAVDSAQNDVTATLLSDFLRPATRAVRCAGVLRRRFGGLSTGRPGIGRSPLQRHQPLHRLRCLLRRRLPGRSPPVPVALRLVHHGRLLRSADGSVQVQSSSGRDSVR